MWVKQDDYPGFYLCHIHLKAMEENPDKILKLVNDKQERKDKRGRVKKT
jgi:hypothetical protein